MDDQVTIYAPTAGNLHPLRDSGFTALDSEARTQSYRNLAAAAYVYAGVYFVAFMTGWLLGSHASGMGWTWPETQHIVASVPSILMALLIARTVQKRRFQVHSFTRIAEIFLVLSCLGIAGNDWAWQTYVTKPDFAGVHWIGVWLVAFSATVTLPPTRMLRAALLSSLTIPAVALTSIWALGFPPQLHDNGWELTRAILAQIVVPVWICVGIAVVIAARVFHMAHDASKARRLGSYQLEEKLGAGGMGEVWRASHRMLARPAAIKLIREQALSVGVGQTPGMLLRRFEREAQATAALTSPHTVQVYDFGITRDGTFYYVMELLRGMDLRTLVEKTGPVAPKRALYLLRQACDSLADAHAHGMVHRDIKPANLFVCRQGLQFDFLKVLDFGLVKEAGTAAAGETQLTQQGFASGTPGYMAPEVATDKKVIDGRADLYALGCVGYWLLTGTNVFTADSAMELIIKHVHEPPAPMRQASELDIPEAVETLVMQCLAKAPGDRPPSAQALGERIATVQEQIGAWTSEQAEAWWQLHGAELAISPGFASLPLHSEAEVE